jgi:hypothetical protein
MTPGHWAHIFFTDTGKWTSMEEALMRGGQTHLFGELWDSVERLGA